MREKSKKERVIESLLTWGLVIIIVVAFALMIWHKADSAPALNDPYPPPYPDPYPEPVSPYPGPDYLPLIFGGPDNESP